MDLSSSLPWLVLLGYGVAVYALTPGNVAPTSFFRGGSEDGRAPGLWLLVASAAISWVFAKSISNAANLSAEFGLWGGIGYALYYLSFVTAALVIYRIRSRGGYGSLADFLVHKYGPICARLFLLAISIRLFNEVWSNTKVVSLYFGPEGSAGYWTAAAAVTLFTVYYSWQGGLRSSLLTDGVQMLLAAVLLVGVLVWMGPGLAEAGLPSADAGTRWGGLTFCGLALVQVLSYPFHDPVLTDRAFITDRRTMVKGLLLAGLVSGGFILMFSVVGLYARAFELGGDPTVSVPAAIGLPVLLVFNAIMLTSAGSTLDSTFSSSAKLTVRDWPNRTGRPTRTEARAGRWTILAVAVLGNLPLFAVYLGDEVGPAVITATTVSGTMVMGLAPIFLLSFVSSAGRASFHLAFWPGLALGVLKVLEGAVGAPLFPGWVDLGVGGYADDLGVNVYGLLICTTGYLAGAVPGWLRETS